MGQILDHIRNRVLGRAKIGSTKRRSEGLLEGAHLSMSHGRSQEYDDLRQYVPGDDIRDVDWKASARSGELLVKRYIAQRQHRIQLVADVGRDMLGRTPSGELKKDVAIGVLGVVGISSAGQGDEVGLTYGDGRGAARIAPRRGETHLEMLLKSVHEHRSAQGGGSNLLTQLRHVRHHNRQRQVLFIVSDQPELNQDLIDELKLLAAKHKVFWIIIQDEPLMPALSGPGGAVDVATGDVLLPRSALGRGVIASFERDELARQVDFEAKMQGMPISWAKVSGTSAIVGELSAMIRRSNHHGA